MSSTHEIVTIQCGPYANFIGTHWWNMQEASFCYLENTEGALEINHDVLFREGINQQKEVTFTPRLLAIDTKSNLRSLKKEGSLYSTPDSKEADILWHEAPAVIQEKFCEKNAFLQALDDCNQSNSGLLSDAVNCRHQEFNLDDDVTVWSDYLKIHFHPRSIFLIDEYSVHSDGNIFETYDYGLELYKHKAVQDVIEDRIRQFVEECDYLQGFHFLVDGDNSFCAVSSCILLHLDEEFKKKAKVVYPAFQKCMKQLIENADSKSYVHHLYSTILGFNSFTTSSSYFSPLSLYSDPYQNSGYQQFSSLSYKPGLPYHTSSILATTLETSTASYRLKKKTFLLSDIADNLVLHGRKLLSSGICLPFTFQECTELTASSSLSDCYRMQPVTPCFNPETQYALAQLAVLRGIPDKTFSRISAKLHVSIGSAKENFFGQYLNKYSPSGLTFATVLEEKCVLSLPFPNILSQTGTQDEGCNVSDSSGAMLVAAAATLSNSNAASDILQGILAETRKHTIKLKCLSSSTGSEYERDDFAETIHNLVTLKENYGSEYSF